MDACQITSCSDIDKKFVKGTNTKTHIWFRWFNEVPVLLLTLIVLLVVLKPF
jgi:protoporphyrinogen IX oxidase